MEELIQKGSRRHSVSPSIVLLTSGVIQRYALSFIVIQLYDQIIRSFAPCFTL